MADKTPRFNRTDGTHLGTGDDPLPASMEEFERLERVRQTAERRRVQFKDLEAAVQLPHHLQHISAAERLTGWLYQGHQLGADQYHDSVRKQGHAVPIEGQRTEGRGQHLRAHHHDVAAPCDLVRGDGDGALSARIAGDAGRRCSIYLKHISLPPGTYRLNVVAKDVIGGNMNNYGNGPPAARPWPEPAVGNGGPSGPFHNCSCCRR